MPGAWGKLTKDKWGYVMPITDPIFDEPPYYYRGVEMLIFTYETDEEAAASILPDAVQLADSPPVANVFFPAYHWSTLGAYNEAVLSLNVLWEGQPMVYVSNLFVDSEVGMIAGREIYGAPKIFGDIRWLKSRDSIMAYCERPTGNRIVSGVMSPRTNLRAEDFAINPLLFFKVIPGAEGKKDKPAVAEYVRVDFEVNPIIGSDGRAEVFLGPGNVTFPSPTEIDPWYRIKVNKMIACIYARANALLPGGMILKKLV